MSEWDPVRAELTYQTDLLGHIARSINALGGTSSGPANPRPRPETAFDRLRTAVREDKHIRLVRRLLPGRNSYEQHDEPTD